METCQNANNSHYFADLTQVGAVRSVLLVLYALVMLVAIAGNQVIIWAILLHSHMRTATNLYILNLAVADFLTAAVVMPLKMVEDLGDCQLTRTLMTRSTCAVASYLMPVIVFASIITLLCISIERFFAVVFPLVTLKLNNACRVKCVLIFCWLVPAVICMPFLVYDSEAFELHSELGSISRVKCQNTKWTVFGDTASPLIEFTYTLFLFVVVYALPAVVIVSTSVWISVTLRRNSAFSLSHDFSTTYTITNGNGHQRLLDAAPNRRHTLNRHDDQKKRVAKMVYFVALFFLCSWTPFYALNLLMLAHTEDIPHHLFIYLVAHLLGFINAAVSPIICFIMSERFRRYLFKAVQASLFCCPRRRSSWLNATSTLKAGSVSTSTYSSTAPKTGRRTVAANIDTHHRSPLSRTSEHMVDAESVTVWAESDRKAFETTHI